MIRQFVCRAGGSVGERSGMTRNQLAVRSGVSYSVVHRFIAGDCDVLSGTLSRLCDVIDMDLRANPKRRKSTGG